MPFILCIETSTKACSVAIGKDGKLLAIKESLDEKYSHAENLTLYIEEVCQKAKVRLPEMDAIAVSKGPGSYTGLRIGVSAAKGLCYALDKPLIAINSLKAMASGSLHHPSTIEHLPSLFCPMIDARRMEVYCAVYDAELNEIRKTAAKIIDKDSFSDLFQENKMIFFGDGAEKCRSMISHPNAVFMEDMNPSAKFMLPLADKLYEEKKFENVAYFEPFYLKDFLDTRPPQV